jgi:hypothetical protein
MNLFIHFYIFNVKYSRQWSKANAGKKDKAAIMAITAKP